MLLVKILALSTLFFSSSGFASELLGYSTGNPNPVYRIQNENKEIIFETNGDDVKNVSLRNGYAVVQTTEDNVSLINEQKNTANQNIVVDRIYGSEYKVSDTLLAVYLPNSLGKVFDHQGNLLYQGIHVQKISVANSYFSVLDSFTNEFSIYSLKNPAKPLIVRIGVKDATLSEHFFTVTKLTGFMEVSAIDSSSLPLASGYGLKNLQISDVFAACTDVTGAFTVYSTQGSVFYSGSAVMASGLNNSFFFVKDASGLAFRNQKGELLFSSASALDYRVSPTHFAVRLPGQSLMVGDAQKNLVQINVADRYELSIGLLLVANGPSEYSVYSFDALGKLALALHTENQNIVGFQLADAHLVGFQFQGLTSANGMGIGALEVDSASATLLSLPQADRLSLSHRQDELNWN